MWGWGREAAGGGVFPECTATGRTIDKCSNIETLWKMSQTLLGNIKKQTGVSTELDDSCGTNWSELGADDWHSVCSGGKRLHRTHQRKTSRTSQSFLLGCGSWGSAPSCGSAGPEPGVGRGATPTAVHQEESKFVHCRRHKTVVMIC